MSNLIQLSMAYVLYVISMLSSSNNKQHTKNNTLEHDIIYMNDVVNVDIKYIYLKWLKAF